MECLNLDLVPRKIERFGVLVVSLFLLLFCFKSFAGECTWTTTGNSTDWNNPIAWTVVGSGCASVPPTTLGPNDNVFINNSIVMTGNLTVQNGGVLVLNSGGSYTVNGSVDLQNGSSFTSNQGSTMTVTGNFNNSNNSTGVVVNGSISVGGNLTSGNGSTVTSSTGTGSFSVSGSISGAGTVFGSTADCADTSVPCVTTAANPLPVELVSINMDCNADNVSISWKTASEYNSDHYSIGRSRDGINWENLGIVQAAGFSTQTLEYNYTDYSYPGSTSYYRVTQVDIDGESEQFPVLTANCAPVQTEFFVYPNPSKNDAYIRFISDHSSDNSLLTIMDLQGNVLVNTSTELVKGINIFPVNSSDMKPGIFLFRLDIPGESSYFTRWIKE